MGIGNDNASHPIYFLYSCVIFFSFHVFSIFLCYLLLLSCIFYILVLSSYSSIFYILVLSSSPFMHFLYSCVIVFSFHVFSIVLCYLFLLSCIFYILVLSSSPFMYFLYSCVIFFSFHVFSIF